MKSLNLGILAHVDAGKTSLTERLLYAAGVIDDVGRVDDGDTHTDTLALEQQRGITIRSAVVAFTMGGTRVNLLDTPGHSDFVAEVERVLGVLDGAVLVVSAAEGVQAQTRVLMRALQRLTIPTIIFVNKADRTGAAPRAVADEIADRLSPAGVPMGWVRGAGTRSAAYEPASDDTHADQLLNVLTTVDDDLLTRFVERPDGVALSELDDALIRQTHQCRAHPVFFGSAVTGAGIESLRSGITRYLPAGGDDTAGTARGEVFKLDRGAAGEKVAYVRMTAGRIGVRERVALPRGDAAKVTALRVFDQGDRVERDSVTSGEIAQAWGLSSVRVGDTIGSDAGDDGPQRQFSPPSLETVVDPERDDERIVLLAALTDLAEQDPFIDVRHDDVRREVSLSLYGEVQKQVVQALLAADYGLDVTFRETTTLCVEQVAGTGAAAEFIATEPNPFLATVGLRVEPGPVGGGIEFRIGVELGSMPRAFFSAVEEAVASTLREGLRGWRVTDSVVTMTHSGYWARQSHSHGSFDPRMSSTAGDFRGLTPLVLMEALRRAGTRVCEPVHRFELETPADALGDVLAALAQLQGVPRDAIPRARTYVVTGYIPAAHVHRMRQRLPGLTGGEGELITEFDRHSAVRGSPPERRRTDANPLDRREYLRRVR